MPATRTDGGALDPCHLELPILGCVSIVGGPFDHPCIIQFLATQRDDNDQMKILIPPKESQSNIPASGVIRFASLPVLQGEPLRQGGWWLEMRTDSEPPRYSKFWSSSRTTQLSDGAKSAATCWEWRDYGEYEPERDMKPANILRRSEQRGVCNCSFAENKSVHRDVKPANILYASAWPGVFDCFLVENGSVHRNVKPDNILYTSE